MLLAKDMIKLRLQSLKSSGIERSKALKNAVDEGNPTVVAA